MSLPWFRLYGETVDDAKLRLLAFEDRWHYIAILCCKAQGILDATKPDMLDRMVGAKLGLAARELDEARRRLIEVDLIAMNWQPTGWERRQFKSDDVTARTRKFRNKSSEQEEESKTDTDTEGERSVERSANVPAFDAATVPGLDLQAWALWIEHRKAIKKPIRPHSLPDAAEALAKLGDQQMEEVKRARAGGWQGLHPDKASAPRLTKYEQNMARLKASSPAEPSDNFLLGKL